MPARARLFTLRAVADGTSLPHRRSPLNVKTVVLEGSWYTLTNSLRLSRGRPRVRSASRESERAAAMMGVTKTSPQQIATTSSNVAPDLRQNLKTQPR